MLITRLQPNEYLYSFLFSTKKTVAFFPGYGMLIIHTIDKRNGISMNTNLIDTGVVQTDYFLNGKVQKLFYRKTNAGLFIYGSSAAVSLTNHLETVIAALVDQKIIEAGHTSTGHCLYYRDSEILWNYRDSEILWNQVSFVKNGGKVSCEWIGDEVLVSDEDIAFLIDKTTRKIDGPRYPRRQNANKRLVGWG